MYLNWEAEAFTIPWVTFCTRLSINLPLSHNLQYLIGLLAMKQLKMLESYTDVYDSFMTLPVDPPATWMRGHEANTYQHAWWLGPLDTEPDEVFFNTYPNCVEVKELFTEHFLQLPEGTAFITPATLIKPKIMLVAQQVSTIHAEIQQEGNHLLEMIEDKVIEARIVAASLMQMDSLLGWDVGAIEWGAQSTGEEEEISLARQYTLTPRTNSNSAEVGNPMKAKGATSRWNVSNTLADNSDTVNVAIGNAWQPDKSQKTVKEAVAAGTRTRSKAAANI
ncbi:hypothetical protein F4604DRAFT_1685243 [Suillus subluteus]|nr:hypothetical protein F4604DRAFT_1685243 [Suillus subluteus]